MTWVYDPLPIGAPALRTAAERTRETIEAAGLAPLTPPKVTIPEPKKGRP